MIKILIISVFILSKLLSVDMPPMPPMMPSTKAKTKIKQNKPSAFQTKLEEIEGCSSLPPMIIFLPPPMEKSLIQCRNNYYKPTKKDASKKLSKLFHKKIKVTKIKIMSKFREVYKIYIRGQKSKYCNKDLNSCLK
jgi:hypothetical protein